ncbi:MAG: hypothetical protein ACI841_001775 [Planctomycetota bacterium]|jgi:hypothetical protein
MLILFVPYMLMLQMQQWGAGYPIKGAPQAGGLVAGRVTDEDGTAITEHKVELFLVLKGQAQSWYADTVTDEQGEYQFQAPALDGHYLVHAGGGDWRRVAKPLLLVGDEPADGKILPELEFELQPGAILIVQLSRADGRPIRGGVLRISGQLGTEWPWNRWSPSVHLDQKFEGEEVIVDGLPALSGEVEIELENGRSVRFDLELEDAQRLEYPVKI